MQTRAAGQGYRTELLSLRSLTIDKDCGNRKGGRGRSPGRTAVRTVLPFRFPLSSPKRVRGIIGEAE